jgi:hypothetical protein
VCGGGKRGCESSEEQKGHIPLVKKGFFFKFVEGSFVAEK